MITIKNRYGSIFLFDTRDGNPNGGPDSDNIPRTDEKANHGLVADVCIKRKVHNYTQLLKDLKSPYDISTREGNILNTIVDGKRTETDKREEDKKRTIRLGHDETCNQYFDIQTFGIIVNTSDMKANGDSSEEKVEGGNRGKRSKRKDLRKKIKGLSVVYGPVQLTFARSISPVDTKSHSLACCYVTIEDGNKDGHTNTIENKNTVSYGLYRVHGLTFATDAAKTRFPGEDKETLFNAIINTFEDDHATVRGEVSPRALIVFKHESSLGNARAEQLFDLT